MRFPPLRAAAGPPGRRRPLAAHVRAYLSTAQGGGGDSSGAANGRAVEAYSAVTQHQLSFCCLLCGWDSRCSTCPINWYGFDPHEFRKQYEGSRRGDAPPLSSQEMSRALEMLGMARGENAFTEQDVKAAFREQALRWHPDCNQDPAAEDRFKEIVAAYELLIGRAAKS